VEENCQVFSESFLLISTSGYANFTLTPGQVVAPELPELLAEEEAQVLVRYQDQADGTLDALDTVMARGLAGGQQREISLRDFLTDIQHKQYERRHYNWIIAAVALALTIPMIYLTSKCWRPLLEFASRYVRRRTRVPARVPVPKLRCMGTCALSMDDGDETYSRRRCRNRDGNDCRPCGTGGGNRRAADTPPRKVGEMTKPPPCPNLLACGTLSQAGTSPESLMDPGLTECYTVSRFDNGPHNTHRDVGFPVLDEKPGTDHATI
jgi:hypothetical protein